MTTTDDATTDPTGCILETYESHTAPNLGEPDAGQVRPVLVCRAHPWAETLEPGEDPTGERATALVAAHRAHVTGRVLHAEGGTLVIEVHDPTLYTEPGLVEGLRQAFGAAQVVGIDPRAMHLYVTPDDDAVKAMLTALRAQRADVTGKDRAAGVVKALADAGVYLVRVPRRAD